MSFVLGAAACGEETPTSPTPTEPVLVTDTFSGTINKNGAATHQVTTVGAGTLTATLTELTPDADLVMGLGVGLWNGTTCNVIITRDQAVRATVIYANVNAAAEVCVRIHDVGRLADTADYTITVVHP